MIYSKCFRVIWRLLIILKFFHKNDSNVTRIARAQIVLDALIDQIDQITVLADQNRYKKITLKEKTDTVEIYVIIKQKCQKYKNWKILYKKR